jgi:hypothetical protein
MEAASMLCEENFVEIRHKKPCGELAVYQLLKENGFNYNKNFEWRSQEDLRTTVTLTEDGFCETFNAIDANLIFRNDTVDPKFIEEYQEKHGDIRPVFWSMEEGYTSNNDNYPYRVFDSKSKALKFRPSIPQKKFYRDIEQGCNGISENFKIIVSHPAEVPRTTTNIMAPFNKSVVVLVNPKVTRTSENLKSVDPNV